MVEVNNICLVNFKIIAMHTNTHQPISNNWTMIKFPARPRIKVTNPNTANEGEGEGMTSTLRKQNHKLNDSVTTITSVRE